MAVRAQDGVCTRKCIVTMRSHDPVSNPSTPISMGGQTTAQVKIKNNYIIWFFQDLIRRGVYSRIDLKFLTVGHTYGPTDRTFGVIEKHTSKLEAVHTPQEWYEQVRCSSVIVRVTEIDQSSFRDYRHH